MTETITIIATQHAKPEQREALGVQIYVLSEAARTEAGCLDYRVAVAHADPHTFVFFERWASREALDAHFQSPVFQAFWNNRMNYLDREVDVVVASEFV